MSTRRISYCSTCKKYLTSPEIRNACEAAGHTLTTKMQKLTPSKVKGLLKRCKHPRKEWGMCTCPWYAHVRVKGTVHRGVLGVFEHRIAAETAFAALKERLHNGEPAAAPVELPTSETLKTYATRWLTRLSHLKPSTIYFYRDHMENHIIPELGALPVATLTRPRCKQFVEGLKTGDKKLARTTMVGIVTTLSALMTAAVEDDDCPVSVNPVAKILKATKLRKNKNETRHERLAKDKYFDQEEASHLLTVTREHFPEWYPFVLCGLRTGLRLGELLGLQWGDIDWRKYYIFVQRGWVRAAYTTPKNGETRDVDMSDRLRAELRLWRARQSQMWLKRGMHRPALVFPSSLGTPLDDSNLRKIFAAIVQKAELRHRSPHAMRHTFISLLLQNGESPAYVQKQAGHKSMDVTINVYGHFIPGGNRQAVNRLDGQLGQRQRGAAA